jgi:hypothetical protein
MPPRKKLEPDDTTPQQKRGRKKKIDLSTAEEPRKNNVTFNEQDTIDSTKYNKQTSISVGSINIIRYSATPKNTIDDVKKLFENEQHSNVLIQDTTQQSNIVEDTCTDSRKKRSAKKAEEDISSVGAGAKKSVPGTSKNVYKVLDTTNAPKGIFCLWCCHPFENSAVSRPISFDKTMNLFNVTGIYCSWSCVAAHSIECEGKLDLVFKLKDLSEKDSALKDPTFKITDDLQPSPPRESLINFGGHMTIEQFRNAAITKGYVSVLTTDRISHVNRYILEHIEA